MCLLLSIYWAASIPYSRFLLGAHSLDQIVYGSTLGVWEAFTLHWLVRDNLIRHMSQIKLHKQQSTYKDIENQQADACINDDLREFSISENRIAEFSGNKYSLLLFIFYISYESLSILTFLIIDQKLPINSDTVVQWRNNYEKGCNKEMDMTYSLQNACLNSCGYLT